MAGQNIKNSKKLKNTKNGRNLKNSEKLKSLWKIKKLEILTCICGFLQYFLAKIKKLSDYFSAKIKKLTGWIFDKFLIKKTACMLVVSNKLL